jgi:hypothetical protein
MAGGLLAAIGGPGALFLAGRALAQGSIGYDSPVVVDTVRHGGEPLVIYSHKGHDLVYTSHEGTTHLDREGLTGAGSVAGFACNGPLQPTPQASCYSNHVWIWTSDDHGKTWTWRDEGLQYTGFSDPDLTEDAAGNVYNTGIDLANDSLFSSPDGGKSWPTGTAQCHDGDRPWLAGGQANEVFMSTDTVEGDNSGHQVFRSGDGASCSASGIPDNGTLADGTVFSGFGKLVYDPVDGSIIEPARFDHKDGTVGVGISRLPNAAHAFAGGGEKFLPQEAAHPTTVFSPFGAPEIMTIDSQENLYFAWDTNEREAADTKNGCGKQPGQPGGPTPKPNHVMFEAARHTGPGTWQFLAPVSLESNGPARIAGARVLWPWTAAGSPGNASVVWYQMDQLVDPDCDIAAATGQPAPDVKTYIYEARVTDALDPGARTITVTNASGRAVHKGGICDSGTTCAATGQDRRLGDYFSNSTDSDGCVVIASGDTTTLDSVTGRERITSLPIFIHQNSGPGLLGQDCGPASQTKAAVDVSQGGEVALPNTSPARSLLRLSLIPLLVAAAILGLAWRRRPSSR